MLEFTNLKSIIAILEKNKIAYYVFGGVALEGIRGTFSREHNDLDVFIIDIDLEKFLKHMDYSGFSCHKKENMYFLKKDTIKIGVAVLTRNNESWILTGNQTIEVYPQEIFSKDTYGKIGILKFRIVPHEVLIFEAQFSKHDADKNFCSKLKYNKKLFQMMRFTKIRN
jgi:hypothetical protein